jgi:isopenicillin-N epimerase
LIGNRNMRDAFLLDPEITFLNHGSFGACPREVFAQYQHWQLALERNPVDFLGRRSTDLLWHARQRLGAYLGARADDLVFVPNATTAINIVARSLPLQPGDEILASDHEYGACDATWRFVCDKTGAHYKQIGIPLPFEPERFTQRVLEAITPRTRVIFLSHITSTTALIFPLAELCVAARARGITTLVDGAHAPGHIELQLDSLGADYYTGNCHKWLCAPKGSAFLHVRAEHQATLDSNVVSWGYVAEAAGHTGFDAYTGSTWLERRFQWQGTRDIAAFLTVSAAIDFQARHDWATQRQQCRALAWQTQQRVLAHNGLQPIAPQSACGQMVAIPVRLRRSDKDSDKDSESAEGLRHRLFEQHHIEVPVTQHAGQTFVRVSVQAYNTQAELDSLVSALTE